MSFDLRQTRARLTAAPFLKTSFGPFQMLEAVPWLMLASSLRFAAYGMYGIIAFPLLLFANAALFLAFLVAARRMIELSNGQTELGRLSFQEESSLAVAVVSRILVLMVMAVIVMGLIGRHDIAPAMMLGFDGIAFDQSTRIGMVWSSVLACIVLLMVVRIGIDPKPSLWKALAELSQRAAWLVPAIIVAALFQVALSSFQGVARIGILHLYMDPSVPELGKKLAYFSFVFGFASLRLWVTLAVLIFGLRESYRRS